MFLACGDLTRRIMAMRVSASGSSEAGSCGHALMEGWLRDYIGQRFALLPAGRMGQIHASTVRWRRLDWMALTLVEAD
jgi:hypothetical protein